MAKTYRAYNFAMPTTASPTLVTTGTAVKTMLQIATPSTEDIAVVEWGVMIDAGAQSSCAELDRDGRRGDRHRACAAGVVKMNAADTTARSKRRDARDGRDRVHGDRGGDDHRDAGCWTSRS
jgi:hypothetical protein